MYEKFLKTVNDEHLIVPGSRIGIAASGGVDSMVLMNVLYRLTGGKNLYCLHFEHGIRGWESVRDMEFVRENAKALGIPFICARMDIPERVMQTGENLEAAARRYRYAFFANISKKYNLQYVATAHHADDVVETFLLNLLRGSGMAGLSAMRIRREPNIIRPLINISREEIEQYAAENEISFVTDSTNDNLDYTRNFLRKEVVPKLKELNPNLTEAVRRTTTLLGEDEYSLFKIESQIFEEIASETKEGLEIDIDKLLSQHIGIQKRVIRHSVLKVAGSLVDFEMKHSNAILELANNRSVGKRFILPGKCYCTVGYGKLIIKRDNEIAVDNTEVDFEIDKEIRIAGKSLLSEVVTAPQSFPALHEAVQFADPLPLEGALVRTRRSGDLFRPVGMEGYKKLSDWFIDEKIPQDKRDLIPLVVKENRVLVIGGHAVSEDAKVQPGQQLALRIEVKEQE
ncbi:MAG: tRNA lysidine(34) synthetase TilS [Christensenellaceae bacterium]|nr:tRNA lysidine(34) synthetase TilS [Christensenellaceae bacterium]